MTDASTVGELAAALTAVGGRLRIAARRGGFTVAVEWPNGNAAVTNVSLGAALDAAVRLLHLYSPEPIPPAVADPEGAKVGPAPRPNPTGTCAGYRVEAHCAFCGFGEEPGQAYDARRACSACGGMEPCTKPNGHDDGIHTVAE